MNEDPAPSRSCERCDRDLAPGAPHYRMHLRLTSGFDGHLPDLDLEGARAQMLHLVDACAERSTEDLEAEVDLEMRFVICPRCRDRIASDPLQEKRRRASEP